jgi:predicted dienelactone hydrolase
MIHPHRLLCFLTWLLWLATGCAVEVPPISTGPYAVGSTYFEAREKPPEPIVDYLIGADGWFSSQRYVGQILRSPEAAFQVQVRLPGSGGTFPVFCYVLYPTPTDNPRPSYRFPYANTGDNVFPHMQRPSERPSFAQPGTRWPVVLASHGYNAHGLWELDRWKRLASQGYIVVSIFHGDGRWSYADNFTRRPVAVKQVLDRLLGDRDFGPAIDPDRIGASGSSFGGYTILACLGGSDPATGRADYLDPRIKVGFGLVPFAGGTFRSPFGEDFSGLKTVTKPYLAVYGGNDRPDSILAATGQCSGKTMAVLLPGEEHLLSQTAWNDVPTWEILFFNAWLKDDARAKALLQDDLQVRGGVDDRITQRDGKRTGR